MFESYNEIGASNIQVVDIVSGVASFFVVALGGTIIGKLIPSTNVARISVGEGLIYIYHT